MICLTSFLGSALGRSNLCLCRRAAEIHGNIDGLLILDRAVYRFIFFDIISQGFHEPFGMLGGQDNPGLDFGLGETGHYIHEIYDKFCVGMGNDGQVSINAFGHFLAQLNIELLFVVRNIFHQQCFRPAKVQDEKHKCVAFLFMTRQLCTFSASWRYCTTQKYDVPLRKCFFTMLENPCGTSLMKAPPTGIKSWAKDDRPREKMLLKGAQTLSDTELLAILIGSGNHEKSALDLAKEILANAQHQLNRLSRKSVKELTKTKGIGEAKAITIVAALELGRRRQAGNILERPAIRNSRDAANILQPLLADNKHEVFAVLFLNNANRVVHFEIVSSGGMTGTVADPKIILRKALEHDAIHIMLCHNHPSGNLDASQADRHLTRKLCQAAQLLDMKVLDHLIVSEKGYYSFADEGMLAY